MSEPATNLPRLALVGASSLLGTEIKDKLAASGYPGDTLTLFDLGDIAGVLTTYGEEARVLAETIADDLLAHELVMFAGDPESATEHAEAMFASERLAVDCTGAWADHDDVFAWIPGTSAPPCIERHSVLRMPSADVIAVAMLCRALDEFTSRISLTVMSPASELGDAGIQELAQQSTAVLNLLDLDREAFGRQQAFDLWIPGDQDRRAGAALGAELRGMGVAPPALNVIAAPIFHGIALTAFVADASVEEVSRHLQEAGLEHAGAEADSPRLIVGTDGVKLLRLHADAGGVWVWAAADNLTLRANAAVAAAHTLLGSPLSDALQ